MLARNPLLLPLNHLLTSLDQRGLNINIENRSFCCGYMSKTAHYGRFDKLLIEDFSAGLVPSSGLT